MSADLGPRVLIADADPAWRQRLFTRLLDLDVFADCVANGDDALRKLIDIRYTLVVLDLGLCGVDAAQVLAHIARMPSRPVVLASASDEAARALEVDIVQMVLRKPVDLVQISELVRNCVRATRRPATSVGGDDARDHLA